MRRLPGLFYFPPKFALEPNSPSSGVVDFCVDDEAVLLFFARFPPALVLLFERLPVLSFAPLPDVFLAFDVKESGVDFDVVLVDEVTRLRLPRTLLTYFSDLISSASLDLIMSAKQG